MAVPWTGQEATTRAYALKHSDIHVETNDHVVTLTGTVASSTAKTRAEPITSGTEGMTRVINQPVVKRQ